MSRTLVFGLGSGQGDDQLGWLVVERLAAAVSPAQAMIRRAVSPSELLDLPEGVDRLIVCDACHSLGAPGAIHRWRWPDVPVGRLRSTGSHDLGIGEVLKLAEQLCLLPPEVFVYAVEVASSAPLASVSIATQATVKRLAAEIIEFLQC